MERRAVNRPPGARAALLVAALLCACGEGGTIAARPRLEVPLRALDFGAVPVLVAREASLELQNFGRVALAIESVEIVPADGAFSVIEAPAGLEAGASGAVRLAFRADRLADFAATARIRSDDPEEPLVEVSLTGSGATAGRIEAPERIEFLGACEGSELLRRIKLRSSGSADLVIERIAFSEGTAAEFAFVSSTRTPVTVPAGGELLLAVRYAPGPGAPAEARGAVTVESADPDRRALEVALTGTVNRAPVAVIADLAASFPGQVVALDGRGSGDADGDGPLLFAWGLKSSPIGSTARPLPVDEPEASLALDLPGEYVVQLDVSDARGCRAPTAFAQVVARPAEELLVELVWDNQRADLDLHLAPEGEPFFGPRDCYYAEGHLNPDWGVPGDPADDPLLTRDALSGYGPEMVAYAQPAAGRYRVMAHYYSAHESDTPATTATVRVYVHGALRSELRRSLWREGLAWTALSVDWPSGEVAEVDSVR